MKNLKKLEYKFSMVICTYLDTDQLMFKRIKKNFLESAFVSFVNSSTNISEKHAVYFFMYPNLPIKTF